MKTFKWIMMVFVSMCFIMSMSSKVDVTLAATNLYDGQTTADAVSECSIFGGTLVVVGTRICCKYKSGTNCCDHDGNTLSNCTYEKKALKLKEEQKFMNQLKNKDGDKGLEDPVFREKAIKKK